MTAAPDDIRNIGTEGRFPSAMPTFVGLVTVAALMLGLGVWAVGSRIDGAVVAPGRIVVERNRQIVQHPEGGVVEEILVREGDTVAEGQLLIRLDPELTQSELSVVENQLYEVMARRGRLEAERDDAEAITFDPELLAVAAGDPTFAELVDGQERLFEARLESLRQSITQFENQEMQLENQIGGIDAQLAALQQQQALTQEELTMQQGLLDRGLTEGSRVLNLRREEARLLGLAGEFTARRAEAMERIAEIRIQTVRLQSDRREQAITALRDLQITELGLIERRNSLLTRLERADIRAPVAGIVYDLRVLGRESVIRAADPLLFIVPQDRPLVIEAQVDTINVNEVHVGQEVIMRFRTIESQATPDLYGTIMSISPDAFEDPNSGQSYYRTEVMLPEAELAKLPEGQILIPGMIVDTFIRTGEHSPLAYLAAPLSRYFGTAMR